MSWSNKTGYTRLLGMLNKIYYRFRMSDIFIPDDVIVILRFCQFSGKMVKLGDSVAKKGWVYTRRNRSEIVHRYIYHCLGYVLSARWSPPEFQRWNKTKIYEKMQKMTVFFAHFIVLFLSEQSKRIQINFKQWRHYLGTVVDQFRVSWTHPFFAIEAPNWTIFWEFRNFRNYELLVIPTNTNEFWVS